MLWFPFLIDKRLADDEMSLVDQNFFWLTIRSDSREICVTNNFSISMSVHRSENVIYSYSASEQFVS